MRSKASLSHKSFKVTGLSEALETSEKSLPEVVQIGEYVRETIRSEVNRIPEL